MLCMALALDAEKAFDQVSCLFLLKVLEKYGFGPIFIQWIRLLYSAPRVLLGLMVVCINPVFFEGEQDRAAHCLLFFLPFVLNYWQR